MSAREKDQPKETVRLENISRTFHLGGKVRVEVLKAINISIRPGEFIGIMGPSGSGKSTLLNILGLLDRPSNGQYFLYGKEVARLSDDELAKERNSRIGFIFQSFNLFPHLTVEQNIEVPMVYAEIPLRERRDKAEELGKRVGLGHRLKHRPGELSGGECQRIAIARALANDPAFLLADEPTGNLDDKTGDEIMAMIQDLHQNQGATIIMVTHNPELQTVFDRIIRLRDGFITAKEEAPE